MDTAVALVQAYLHVNGYFTVTEYPVLEAFHRDHTRAVTDLDVLAFRFAHAAHDLKRGRGRRPLEATLAAKEWMQRDSIVAVVFAGDEGSAAAVALESNEYRCPTLKLTADARSMTPISPYLIEFLPSAEAQARAHPPTHSS